jgi:C4-dicarboxylate-binding protein DctP
MAEFGATGIPIDFAEALAAIQNKVIDGARSAITVMGPSRFYTVAKYITLTADIYVPSGIWVSKLWLDKLPSDVRKVVDDVSKEAVPLALRYSIEVTNRWEDEWAKNGGEVIRFAAADRAEYMRRASPLGENFLGKHDNAKVREMYQLLRSVADATRGG